MTNNTRRSHQSGFTLLEIIAATFVIVLVAGGVFSLVVFNQRASGDAATHLEAAYLAQEGIEVVRNLRDANFLAIRKNQCDPIVNANCWKGGVGSFADLTGCATRCEADHDDVSLATVGSLNFLNRDANGMYTYGAVVATPFKRQITIDHSVADTLEVNVEVSWGQQKVVASTELYNWLELPSPLRTAGSPSGTLLPATSATLELETDQNATCRYSTTAGTRYDSIPIPNTFSTTGGTSHSQNVPVSSGSTYTYYVRCQGNFFNTNVSDFEITFSIAAS